MALLMGAWGPASGVGAVGPQGPYRQGPRRWAPGQSREGMVFGAAGTRGSAEAKLRPGCTRASESRPRRRVSPVPAGSPSLNTREQLSYSSSQDLSRPCAGKQTAGDRGGWGWPRRGDPPGSLQDGPEGLGTWGQVPRAPRGGRVSPGLMAV